MSKVRLVQEVVTPEAPPAGYARLYFKDDQLRYQLEDGNEHVIDNVGDAIGAHVGDANAHSQYLTVDEADALYAELAHVHATGNLIRVSKTPAPNEHLTISAAVAAAVALAPSTTNRFVIQVGPGEYTEDPGFTIPAYVYVTGLDPWNSAIIKTSDPTVDFINLSSNSGLFNIGVSGPTTPGKSAILQLVSGTTKLYWVNIKEGYYGITLAPVSGAARCHCIGVVTDGPTQMNRMFNVDNPAGIGIFILMQSGPMSTTWVGSNPAAVYVNGSGSTAPYKSNVTMDLCQFRGTGYDAIYVDNAGLIRGISCSFAGGTDAIHVGPNGASKVDMAASQIKPGGWTKDIYIESATAIVTFSGIATESKLDIAEGATFTANFADTDPAMGGQVVYGEIWIGNTHVKTPLASYVQADKNAGLVTGGSLSKGANPREVLITAGSAFVDTPSGLKKITWADSAVTVSASVSSAIIHIDNDGVPAVSYIGIDNTRNVKLGTCGTDADSVTYLIKQQIVLPHFRSKFYDYLEQVVGPINVSGGLVTVNGTDPLKLDITESSYFVTEEQNVTLATVGLTYNRWHRDGLGGWTVTEGLTTVNTSTYDDGTGTLAAMTAGKFKRDLLFVTSNGGGAEFHMVVGQELFDTALLAINNPVAPDVLTGHTCRVAGIIVEQGAATIATIIDQRPRLGQFSSSSTAVTSHQELAGRDDPNAHSQYQLEQEKGAPNGYAPLDGDSFVPLVNLPAIPHGNLGGSTLHSAATSAVSGFMSAADKVKLDAINGANVPTTGEKAALAGTSGTPVDVNNKLVDSSDSRLVDDRRAIPQGATKQVQYNNAGTSDGATNVLIDGDERLVMLPATYSEAVAVPAAGLKIYGRKRGGRTLLETVGPMGLASTLQHALFNNNAGFMLPQGNSTTVSVVGLSAGSVTGSATARTAGTTNFLAAQRRIGYVSNSNAGNLAGWREGVAQNFLGNAPKMGGFFIACRFGLVGLPSDARWFVGLVNSTAAPSNVEPTAVNQVIGIGCGNADTNIQAWGRAVAGITPEDTGILGKANNSVFELRIFVPPNSTQVGMSLQRLDTDEYWESNDIGATTALPDINTMLGIKMWVCNNNTAGAVALDLISLYKESGN